MVANDKKNLRLLGFISLGLIFFVIFLAFFTTYLTPSDAPTGSERIYLFSISILLVNGLFGLVRAQRWDKINHRRQVAAARELPSSVPFARPQPTPEPSTLLPPCTIKLRPKWVWILLIPCLLLGLLFLLDLSIGLLVGLDLQIALGLVLPLSPIGFLVCLVFTIAILLPQRIEVTSVGITVRHARCDWLDKGLLPHKQTILWKEAQLFAVRGGRPDGLATSYELSGPFTVVTFARIVRPRWWSLYRPAQPFNDYNAQMDALLALICARTGLLLYDVR